MISIDEAINTSERRARRLWLLSALWAIIMLSVAGIFGVLIFKFNNTQHDLYVLKTELENLKKELTDQSAKWRAQRRQNLAMTLKLLAPNTALTPEQEEFINKTLDKTPKEQPEENPDTKSAWTQLQVGQYKDAYDLFTEIIARYPEYGNAYLGRATADLFLNDYTKSYGDITKALAVDKEQNDQPVLLMSRFGVLMRMGKLDEAKQDAEEALKSGDPPTRAFVANTIGLTYVLYKLWPEAEQNFRMAASIEPSRARGRLENIGLIYLAQSDWKKAYEFSADLEKMSDDTPGGWLWLIEAISAEKMGRNEEAKIAVHKFYEGNKNPAEAFDGMKPYMNDELRTLAERWVHQH